MEAKKSKWSPSVKLALAIGKVEEQATGDKLTDWGTGEHLACVRYLVHEFCDATGKLDKVALKKEFGESATFLGYASNAKKLLTEFGTLDAKGAVGGYE